MVRTVLRSPWWNIFGFAALGLMAIATLATVDSTTDRLVQAGFLILSAGFSLIAVRFLFSRVIVRPDGLQVVGAVLQAADGLGSRLRRRSGPGPSRPSALPTPGAGASRSDE